MDDRHIRIAEQNLSKDVFDKIALIEDLLFPCLILDFGTPQVTELLALKKLFSMVEGSHYAYLLVENNFTKIGKLDRDIDVVKKLLTLNSKMKIFEAKDKTNVTRLRMEDLVCEIKI